LWLFADHMRSKLSAQAEQDESGSASAVSSSLLKTVLLLAFTDLAFSIDSVATAVAISDQMLLVITGAVIGIIALRFTSALFVRWLEEYPRLETAGFLAVAIVAIKLILHVLFSNLHQPDWLTLLVVLMLFGWGLSQSRSPSLALEPEHAD
jgi:predicted tellurium resistance membrane protein TerC